MKPDDLAIDVKYLDGPFRYLDNRWRFEPAGENECVIDFFIDYAFRNRMLGVVMGSMFDRAFRMFAEAFEKRADEIYSRTPPA
jgi:coenzyme Q-binding protein COQ10